MKSYRFKKAIIMVRGKINKMKKPNISWLIFGLCILLMLMLLIPPVFQRVPVYDFFRVKNALPYELSIYGQIFLTEDIQADVYVGGYMTTVDEFGKYTLDFLSASKETIIVCIVDDEHNIIDYSVISFSKNEWSKEINICLE